MQQILVLCVGNVCRSPLAEAMLARALPGKTVRSAGLHASAGSPADPASVEVAASRGLDISAHRAQLLSGWMCAAADLILVMEQRHMRTLEARSPQLRGKVFRLGELGDFDIADPLGQPRAAFESACTAIASGVAAWAPRISSMGMGTR